MSFHGNRLEQAPVAASDSEAAFRVMDDWLRLEIEHTNPGLILPSRAVVVAWCENHAGAIMVLANTVLWTPLVWAMVRG